MNDDAFLVGTLITLGIFLMFVASVWLWGPLALMSGGAALIILAFVVGAKVEAAKRRQS